MVTQMIDGISFQLAAPADLSFLNRFGRVFRVFDKTGSGCISFGVDDGREKLFVKVAGVQTIRPYIGVIEAARTLRQAAQMYCDLAHPALIQLLELLQEQDYTVAVFRWAEGECLFDYWNFDAYAASRVKSPAERFRELPIPRKLAAFDTIFAFGIHMEQRGYVALDFYDGSILYDFETGATTICDIDFSRKLPATNDMGESLFGTKRLKAPEEYQLGATLDSITNVHTIGALLFHYFGSYDDNEIRGIYANSRFSPCRPERWSLSTALYQVARKATQPDQALRYPSISDFYAAWKAAAQNSLAARRNDN